MSRTSKFLSRILRHEPEAIGLSLRSEGWVLIDELLRALNRAGHPLTRAELEALVASNDKQRFTISEDGRRIRAAQGHSITVDLGLSAVSPPAVLYHGTTSANLDAIFAEGIQPGQRQYVHLSLDTDTAQLVGRRHGRAVVLRINAAAMHADGYEFFRADNGVWLTTSVPSSYLIFNDADGSSNHILPRCDICGYTGANNTPQASSRSSTPEGYLFLGSLAAWSTLHQLNQIQRKICSISAPKRSQHGHVTITTAPGHTRNHDRKTEKAM